MHHDDCLQWQDCPQQLLLGRRGITGAAMGLNVSDITSPGALGRVSKYQTPTAVLLYHSGGRKALGDSLTGEQLDKAVRSKRWVQ